MRPVPHDEDESALRVGYWKAIAVETDDTIEVAAVIFEQETPAGTKFCDHFITVDIVESRDGRAERVAGGLAGEGAEQASVAAGVDVGSPGVVQGRTDEQIGLRVVVDVKGRVHIPAQLLRGQRAGDGREQKQPGCSGVHVESANVVEAGVVERRRQDQVVNLVAIEVADVIGYPAERVAGLCLSDARVEAARVRIEKLHVLPDAASVGVEIERVRPNR